MKKFFSFFFLITLFVPFLTRAQVLAGYVDPAMSHNTLLRETLGEGAYKLIGPYKVVGTPYLFGEKNYGDLYAPDASATHIRLSYNTYSQEVEFYSSGNPNNALVKSPGTVDSFILDKDATLGITEPLLFIYGKHLGLSDKSFYELVARGNRISIYKKYKTDLGVVTTNIVQSELREFDLGYEYYYSDSTKKGTVKKLRKNLGSVISEFAKIKDVSAVASEEEYNANPEAVLRKVVDELDKK